MSRTSRPDPAPRPIPAITIPPDLPIWEKREEIARAIHDHPVTIVCGETGSGKTTQIPKICLAMGRGRTKRIGHTQPRRIAARAVAERIAEELGTPLGKDVGYKVRFTDKTTPGAAIKVMTDGILLAEIQNDPRLWQYDTIILDEAHERSLNVDFLIGYLKRLLEKRRDLRLVVTSATIHPESFAAHFGGAPIVEVSGRAYPVEIRWRPIHEDDADEEGAQEHAIAEALEELVREGPGDVLVFLSSEREIRETAEVLGQAVRRVDRDPAAVRAPRRAATSTGSSIPAASGASCSPPTSPRPRSPFPASATSSTPASRASAASTRAPRCSGCRSSRCRRRAPISAPAAAAGSDPASASASTRRRTTRSASASRRPRSCAPTWRRSSCR